MTLNKERDLTLDIAKGICIILMPITHLSLFTNHPNLQEINNNYFSIFKMPLFFFISGLLFNNSTSLFHVIKSKFDSLIKPTIAISVLIFIYGILKFNALENGFNMAKTLLLSTTYPLWFPIILFITTVFFKTISTIKNKLPRSYFFATIICSLFILSIVTKFALEIYNIRFYAILDYFLILLLGYTAKKRNWLSFIYQTDILIISVIIFSLSIFFNEKINADINLSVSSITADTIQTVAAFLSGIIILLNISKLFSNSKIIAAFFTSMSYSSFFILGLHIFLAEELIYPNLIHLFGKNTYVDILTFTLTILGSWLFYKISFKIPFFKNILLPLKKVKS